MIGQWVVRTTVGALRIYKTEAQEQDTALSDSSTLGPAAKERLLVIGVGRVVRIVILCATAIWVLSLWNYHLPYATAVTRLFSNHLSPWHWLFSSGGLLLLI